MRCEHDHRQRNRGYDTEELLHHFAAAANAVTVVGDRKSTRLNSSHVEISYAVFCLKKKKQPRCSSPRSEPSGTCRTSSPSPPTAASSPVGYVGFVFVLACGLVRVHLALLPYVLHQS